MHGQNVKRLYEAAKRAPILEALLGLATAVLAIIGLARVAPDDMASIATILIGLSLLFEGGSAAAGSREFAQSAARTDFASAVTVEFLGGFTGIILGILALVGVETASLLAASLLIFGATFLLGGVTKQFAPPAAAGSAEEATAPMWKETTFAAGSSQTLIGLASLILGIIGLVVTNSLVVVLCGLLLLGVSILLTGTAIGSRLMNSLRG